MTEGTANRMKQSMNKHFSLNKDIQDTIMKFVAWLEKAGYESYDLYDIWGTRYGLWARRLYYAKNPLGLVLTAPVILMEMICPSLRALFVKKERFATADAQLALGFLNLHKVQNKGHPTTFFSKNDKESSKIKERQGYNGKKQQNLDYLESNYWLDKAKELAKDLIGYSIPGFSGYCWGYPFEWQHSQGRISKNIPLITATPYCFEAFLGLFDATGEDRYLDIARSIANFVLKDLKDTPAGGDSMAGSYHPNDNGMVVNASAYRAFVLFEASKRFGFETYADKAWGNLKFILQSQSEDGSWLYSMNSPTETFIDHFHTCFVLKNLYKINLVLNDNEVGQAIKNGYEYYRRELFDQNGLPKSFSIKPRMQINQLEMYNIAEAISLGVLLRDQIPGAFNLANNLTYLLCNYYQHRRGYFITRTYIGGLKHKVPFLRWPQAQLFYALTNILIAGQSES